MTEAEIKKQILLKKTDLELLRSERKKYESENRLKQSEGLLFDIEQAEKEAIYFQKLENLGLKKEDLPIIGWVLIGLIGIIVFATKK